MRVLKTLLIVAIAAVAPLAASAQTLIAPVRTASTGSVAPTAPRIQSLLPITSGAGVTGEARAPIGWSDFCSRHVADCRVQALSPENAALTAVTWKTLVSVNLKVNEQIDPVTDQDHWGTIERWDYAADGRGDCEDYVLLKRKLLMEAGLPRQALLITVVRDAKGDGHAVLTVKTDRGDFVLDNQEARILPWTETGYRFVKRQSQENPNRWVSVTESAAVLTAAR